MYVRYVFKFVNSKLVLEFHNRLNPLIVLYFMLVNYQEPYSGNLYEKRKIQETLVHAPKLLAEEISKRASLFP